MHRPEFNPKAFQEIGVRKTILEGEIADLQAWIEKAKKSEIEDLRDLLSKTRAELESVTEEFEIMRKEAERNPVTRATRKKAGQGDQRVDKIPPTT